MKKKLSLIFVFMFMLLGLVALNTKPVMAASETEVEAELNNIVVPDKAIIDFPVVSVSVYGSTIEWKSDRTDVISVPTNGGWTTVKRQNVDVTVTLTVTLTNGEIVKTKDFEVKVPKGTTLTNTYKIEYVLNGGTNNAQNPTEYKVGETKELLTPTKGEVEFLGWFNNEKFEGEAITSLPKGLSGDYKLYAKWAPATVTGIEVTTLPTTVNYKALETFDKTGLVVSKLLNDGTKEVVALDELTFDKDVLHFGDDKVVVKWNEFTTEFAITVVKKDYDLSGIKFENAALTYNGQAQSINYTGKLLDGLTAKVQGSATNVTTTPVTITLVFTNTNADYNTPENMTAELTITKAPLKVIASSASIKVGEDVPTFTASYDGFVNGETEKALGGKLTITCSATKTSPAGSYDVIPAGLTAENYEIEFVNGTLTITSGTYRIAASNTTVTYNEKNQMFTVVLKDGETVIEGITFTYTLNDAAFTGATNAGTYEVTVSYNSETYGKGSTVVTFVIEKANYNLEGISLDQTALTYNGKEQNLKLVGTLPEGVSAIFSEGSVNVVTEKEIIVKFTHENANYNEITTTLKGTLTINAKALEKDMFDVIPEQAYTGSAITPEVTGKFNGTALVLGTDFDVEYTSNTDKGTATVTVAGKGNFTGEITLTFVIDDSAPEKAKAAREALVTKYASVLTGTLASTVTKLDVVAENGSVITWASNNTVIKVEKDGTVTILAAETDQEVTLTATVTYGDVSPEYATFTFTVKGTKITEHAGTEEDPFTVEDALNMIEALENGATTPDQYYVRGIITAIEEVSTQHGNATFTIEVGGKSIKCFRLLNLGNVKFTAEDQISVDDEVVVLVKLQKYAKDNVVTPELLDGYIYLIKNVEYTITLDANMKNGTATISADKVEAGTTITITLNPDEGYQASTIVINGTKKINVLGKTSYDLVVTENVELVVTFAEISDTPTENTYEYTFNEKVFSANGSKKLNEVNWSVTSNSTYFGFDSNSGKGQQFGSGGVPATSLVLSTSEITGKIKKIIINTSGAKSISATFSVSVGGKQVGETKTLTATATDYTFDSIDASGEISFSFTQKSKKAIYIKSITIVYEA